MKETSIKCWFGYERSRVDGHWQPVILYHDPKTETDYGNGKRPERSVFHLKSHRPHERGDFVMSQFKIEHPAPVDKEESK